MIVGRRHPVGHVVIAALVCAALSGAGRAMSHEPAIPLEQRVKVAFLFNFAKFVEWPREALAEEQAVFILGVLGDDPLAESLERTLLDKEIQGRSVQVRRFRKVEDLSTCHLLFVGARVAGRLPRVLQALGGRPVLIVGESEGFARRGGIINLVYAGDETRFEINPDAAERARLQISSRLLSLARIIRDRDEERE